MGPGKWVHRDRLRALLFAGRNAQHGAESAGTVSAGDGGFLQYGPQEILSAARIYLAQAESGTGASFRPEAFAEGIWETEALFIF